MIGTNVSKAIEKAGSDPAQIAEAIGLSTPELEARLAGDDFLLPELSQVGGLLGVPTGDFFEGAA